MPALMIPYDTIHMCMHRVGHRLERAANMIIMYIHGAAAVESIAMDGQSIGSKVVAAVTHNSDSQ